ncbi:MAG: SDR family NAD(P)-dependent oxidoreductase [Candidatus Bathyarchaeia archaeon]|jgi:UDP-glucose 4-epimerase
MRKSFRVLVTGGAGFIGSHMVDRLVKDGCDVRVIDNLSTGSLDNIQGLLSAGKVDFVKGDIRDVSDVEKSVAGVDAVIHFAAVTSVPFSVANPELTFDVNLAGTLNLIQASVQAKVGRFVFVSSCAVFGDPESLPVREEYQPDPISPYAESKLLAERYCLGFQDRQLLQGVVLRFFNVYGPRQGMNDYSGVITRFIERIRKKEPLVVYGDGSQTRDFVNVYDVVDAVLASVKSRDAEGEVFNVGSGQPTSINDLAKTLLELAGVDLMIRYEKSRTGDIKNSYADISKAKKLLGFEPKVSLRDGLRVLLEEKEGAC